jgi:hypothetical protein
MVEAGLVCFGGRKKKLQPRLHVMYVCMYTCIYVRIHIFFLCPSNHPVIQYSGMKMNKDFVRKDHFILINH